MTKHDCTGEHNDESNRCWTCFEEGKTEATKDIKKLLDLALKKGRASALAECLNIFENCCGEHTKHTNGYIRAKAQISRLKNNSPQTKPDSCKSLHNLDGGGKTGQTADTNIKPSKRQEKKYGN